MWFSNAIEIIEAVFRRLFLLMELYPIAFIVLFLSLTLSITLYVFRWFYRADF